MQLTHILVADDNAVIRNLLGRLCRKAGYHVEFAINGEELIRKALAQRPALVLTDLEMPLVDGSEAIRQLRNDARTAGVPMLLFSARQDGAPLAQAAGADEFIAKPFTNQDLLSRITAHLRNPRCASIAT
ncbi:MAG TPA: response regulator [Roseiflexaceae bacterium]|nr:response regulator [Roseiflexaceae bacterium]